MGIDVVSETSKGIKHGFTTVGTTAVVATGVDFVTYRGVLIRAGTNNTAVIFIGASNVTIEVDLSRVPTAPR